ncbi:MAG: molecular chaperone Hsp90 [Eubacteriales bacterium]|nr:molecular chaperone Hsp90 [Eubacteriales bacterium]
MKSEIREYLDNKINDLLNANSLCKEAKEKLNLYLNNKNTNEEEKYLKELLNELENDILPVDALVAFTSSDAAIKVFGEEKAKFYNAHANELKEKGIKYCDCPACKAAQEILEKKDEYFL